MQKEVDSSFEERKSQKGASGAYAMGRIGAAMGLFGLGTGTGGIMVTRAQRM